MLEADEFGKAGKRREGKLSFAEQRKA